MNDDTRRQQDRFGEAVTSWWSALSRDRGELNRLRRAGDITAIQMNEAFFDLVREFSGEGNDGSGWYHGLIRGSPDTEKGKERDRAMDVLACVAMVASHIETDSDQSAATLMGRKDGASDHRVSELRFRRLMDSDMEGMARMMVRILPMIDGCASVADAARTVYWWDHPSQTARKRWIGDYYLSNTKQRFSSNEEE
ncbi:MAG: type I-E CRISPR-associated protein Cse2/CasB [Thermoplasmata archaeon]|nr:type I-E CRISPR-associated protein Cse2/CasB [Thermoplasmata archaeon]